MSTESKLVLIKVESESLTDDMKYDFVCRERSYYNVPYKKIIEIRKILEIIGQYSIIHDGECLDDNCSALMQHCPSGIVILLKKRIDGMIDKFKMEGIYEYTAFVTNVLKISNVCDLPDTVLSRLAFMIATGRIPNISHICKCNKMLPIELDILLSDYTSKTLKNSVMTEYGLHNLTPYDIENLKAYYLGNNNPEWTLVFKD